MKKVLTIVLCVAFALSCVGILAACKPKTDPTDQHEHSYAQGWTYDDDYHWHVATCEHTSEISGKAAHSYNNLNKCTVCGYQGEISFSGDTITEATWKAAIEALADIDNFTATQTEKDDGDVEVTFCEVKENVIHTYYDKYDEDMYMIFSADKMSLYGKFNGVWILGVEDSTDHNEFAEYVQEIIEDYILEYTEDLKDAFSNFTYNETSKAYVWHFVDDDTYDVAVKFVGNSIYSLEISITTDEDNSLHLLLDKVGNTDFEVEPLHKHEFSKVWSSNAMYHWHEAVCHSGEIDEKVVHSWGSDNKCSVCGYEKSATVNTQVNEQTFVSALSLKGLINWTLRAVNGGELFAIMQRQGDKLEQLMYKDGEIDFGNYMNIDNGAAIRYIYVEDAWETLAFDDYDVDTVRALYSMYLGSFDFLADSYSNFTYADGKYTATGLTLEFENLVLGEAEFKNATVEIVFNDGELVSVSIAELDGEDELYSLSLVVGQTTVTLPEATAHKHSWKYDWSFDEDEHDVYCEVCSTRSTQAHDFSGENGECTVCGYYVHEHEIQYSYGEKEHWGQCTICYMNFDGKHEFGNDGKCVECGYYPHEHQWKVVYKSEWYHEIVCEICDTSDSGDHDYQAQGEACSVCGVKNHDHQFTEYVPFSYDVDYHTMACECGLNGGYSYMEPHEFGEGTICSKCHAEKHNHVWEYSGEYSEYDHELYCPDCEKTSYESHDYTEETPCSVCGYTMHEHVWHPIEIEVMYHTVQCSICHIKSEGPHVYEESDDVCDVCGGQKHVHHWAYVEGMCDILCAEHEVYCEECGGFDKEAHVGSGVCDICGGEIKKHEANWSTSTTTHEGFCSVCYSYIYGEHTRGEDGNCTVCGYEMLPFTEDEWIDMLEELWNARNFSYSTGTGSDATITHQFSENAYYTKDYYYNGEDYVYSEKFIKVDNGVTTAYESHNGVWQECDLSDITSYGTYQEFLSASAYSFTDYDSGMFNPMWYSFMDMIYDSETNTCTFSGFTITFDGDGNITSIRIDMPDDESTFYLLTYNSTQLNFDEIVHLAD